MLDFDGMGSSQQRTKMAAATAARERAWINPRVTQTAAKTEIEAEIRPAIHEGLPSRKSRLRKCVSARRSYFACFGILDGDLFRRRCNRPGRFDSHRVFNPEILYLDCSAHAS